MKTLSQIMQQAGNFNLSEQERMAAISELANYPCKEVVDVITKCAIVDPSLAVRRQAVEVLQSMDPRTASQVFEKHLEHPNPRIVVVAILSLGQLGYDTGRLLKIMARLIQHPDSQVRRAVATVLEKSAVPVAAPKSGGGQYTLPKINNGNAYQRRQQTPYQNQNRLHVIGKKTAFI